MSVPLGSPASVELGEGRVTYLQAEQLCKQSALQSVLWRAAFGWWRFKCWGYDRLPGGDK